MKGIGARFKKVLLIDDNEIDNFINERMISASNFSSEVIVKNSTDESLIYLKSLSDVNEFPQVIFLDLNMPGKDGFSFLSEFENLNEGLKLNCKIIVLSSSISPDDINKASTNKFVYKYVNKPLNEKYLNAIDF
jgi:CheY-like chemotaxis protein